VLVINASVAVDSEVYVDKERSEESGNDTKDNGSRDYSGWSDVNDSKVSKLERSCGPMTELSMG